MTRVTPEAHRTPPTIRDVARRAGVSVATVSRVFNGMPIVSAERRERVLQAIEDLGYRRNASARNLSVGRTHTIGVATPLFDTPSVVERLRGVAARLARSGYDFLLFGIDTVEERNVSLRDFARRDRVDGLLVISLPLSDAELEGLQRNDLPVVLVDRPHAHLPHVAVDDVRGGEMATEHLLAKGHRRIGFVGDLPANPREFPWSEHRREGFHRALRRAGIEPLPMLEQRAPYGREEAQQLAEAILRADDPPTAIFAASDIQAIGVLQAAESLGLGVPKDLAVIGFDDIDTAAILGLTTVRQPLWQTGVRGVELLLAAIEGDDAEELEELEPLRVVQRRTT
jgi:DNA-binding LacI/PurR family transcriptional regulator